MNGTNHVNHTNRIKWTPYLHALFVKAVNEIGIMNATPKLIYNLMGQPSLTKNQVKSHLQKYRESIKKGKIQVASDGTIITPSESYEIDQSLDRSENNSSRHNQHNDRQIHTTPSMISNTISDTFLCILNLVASQDKDVLHELVDVMGEMNNPELCSAMLRGFNTGVCVGMKFHKYASPSILREDSPMDSDINSPY
jgi:SHAQKYF class myb-like DNA-binding protein